MNMNPDGLKILSLREDPDALEAIITAQHAAYATDPAIRMLLDSIYLEPDRERAFSRFLNGLEFRTIRKLLGLFNVGPENGVCEIGGGPGFLAWALAQSGWGRMNLLEPNPHTVTGTGYLRSRPDGAGVTVHNDLDAWHAGAERYDIVLTKNCIHHFKNIAQAAASIRQKMNDGGRWFAFREWFADTPKELYAQIASHPYCQPYGLYEWPYPSWHYAEAIEIAGFKLEAVIPAVYANNSLGLYQEDEGDETVRGVTAQIDGLLVNDRAATVRAFWEEMLRNRFQGGTHRLFTRPQVFVFVRVPVSEGVRAS
ncbi:methyltransferase domain-containing protein [Azospirillum sp.]|uniref:methyltransferase domain-containing protein n=1 Tax=Azospirillum sp. TaxID=34012 RepID=UPI00262FCE11|nr:methyltransferase domain-containing protein [Azospirillum sp.]